MIERDETGKEMTVVLQGHLTLPKFSIGVGDRFAHQAKAQLARTAMTLQAQRQLNAEDNAAEMHKAAQRPARPPRGARPPVQVPGRAGNGRAFEQAPPQ